MIMPETAFEALERIYRDLEEEIRSLNPVCRASGECCRFTQAGHELWTTPLELDYLLMHGSIEGRTRTDGVCPFLTSDRTCGVRNHRMLGCRIYFCDPGYKPGMADLHEKHFARVKAVMREHGIEYEYFRFMDRIGERFRVPERPRSATS